MSNYVTYTDYDSKKNQSNYVNYTDYAIEKKLCTVYEANERIINRVKEELSHVRGRVSLPTGLSDEEVLRLYHKLGELSIEAAKSNLAYSIMFEEWGLDKDKYSSFFRPVEQIYL